MIKTRYPWQQIIKNENVYQIISFVVLCVMYIGLQLNWYLAAGRDDTYITLWSAFGVSQGHGFVNYNLQPAEISSSLLHVLILSLFALVQPDNLFVINKIFCWQRQSTINFGFFWNKNFWILFHTTL